MVGKQTAVLRAKLTERGVEYQAIGKTLTCWNRNGGDNECDDAVFVADEQLDGTLTVEGLTPDQAIAATMGSGICKDISEDPDLFNCSECGVLLDIASTSKTDDDKWLYKPSFCPSCRKRVTA